MGIAVRAVDLAGGTAHDRGAARQHGADRPARSPGRRAGGRCAHPGHRGPRTFGGRGGALLWFGECRLLGRGARTQGRAGSPGVASAHASRHRGRENGARPCGRTGPALEGPAYPVRGDAASWAKGTGHRLGRQRRAASPPGRIDDPSPRSNLAGRLGPEDPPPSRRESRKDPETSGKGRFRRRPVDLGRFQFHLRRGHDRRGARHLFIRRWRERPH